MYWIELNNLSDSEIADNFAKDTLVIVRDEQGRLEVYNDSNGYVVFDFDSSFDPDPEDPRGFVEKMEAQKKFFKKLIKYLEC